MTQGLQQVLAEITTKVGLPPALLTALSFTIAAYYILAWITWHDRRALLVNLRIPSTRWPGLMITASFILKFLLLHPKQHPTTASCGVPFLCTASFSTTLGAQNSLPDARLRITQFGGLLLALATVVGGVSLADDTVHAFAGGLSKSRMVVVEARPSLVAAALVNRIGGFTFPTLLFAILAGVALLAAWAIWRLLGELGAIAARMWLVTSFRKRVAG